MTKDNTTTMIATDVPHYWWFVRDGVWMLKIRTDWVSYSWVNSVWPSVYGIGYNFWKANDDRGWRLTLKAAKAECLKQAKEH